MTGRRAEVRNAAGVAAGRRTAHAAGTVGPTLVLGVLAAWFGVTVAGQHPQTVFDRVRGLDPTGLLVANWRFFAPEPAQHDYHLLHRVLTADGDRTEWRQTSNITPRVWSHMVWFPGRRRVCKVDFALSGPVPWSTQGCASAGTVHLVGSREEAVAAEKEVARGRHAERPYVLAVQPGIVDETRAPNGRHTLHAYAHVPHGSDRDLGDAIAAQIERFAPGFRDMVLARRVTTARQVEVYNPNCVGGSITGGALSLWRAAMRPTMRWNPYATPLDHVYLCVSVLCFHPAGAGRARNVRCARGTAGAAPGVRHPHRSTGAGSR